VTDFEFLSSIGVQSTIIIQNIDKFQLVSQPSFVIVRIMGRSNLDGTRTKFHIDRNIVRDDGNLTIGDKRMNDKFTVQVLAAMKSRVCELKRSKEGSWRRWQNVLCTEDHRDEQRCQYLPTVFLVG